MADKNNRSDKIDLMCPVCNVLETTVEITGETEYTTLNCPCGASSKFYVQRNPVYMAQQKYSFFLQQK